MKGKDSWSVEANLIASRLRMSRKQIKYKKSLSTKTVKLSIFTMKQAFHSIKFE